MSYFVWRRNDGYVDASLNCMPGNYVTGGAYQTLAGGGQPVTFEKLGEFDTWEEARACILAERGTTDA